MTDLTVLTLAELIPLLQSRQISSREVTQAYLDRIAAQEETIGAYITVTARQALAQADDADRRRLAGEALPPLAGVPCGLKDNICTQGIPTTCASRMLSDFVPPYSAAVYEKLCSAGCVTLGKTNMDEFAMGSSTETSYFHPTRNPRDPARVPGGSSGGSAAAVAAREAAFTLGSDTGGSIRQPAAFCGVVGMKPTYGGVSRYGLVAFASSLDQIGPMTRTCRDNALVMDAIAGYDRRDATSVKRDYPSFGQRLGRCVQGMKVALPQEFFGQGLHPGVKARVMAAARALEGLGAQLTEARLPTLPYALPAYYVISSAEASSNLARFDGVRYGTRAADYADLDDLYIASRSQGFGPEVKRRIMLGTFALSAGYFDAYYKKALQVRTRIIGEFDRVFETCDAILGPVAPTPAYPLGEKAATPIEMYLGDIYTVPVNIAGLPALSLPAGAAEGLPVGVQLIGRPFSEPMLYQLGDALEKEVAYPC